MRTFFNRWLSLRTKIIFPYMLLALLLTMGAAFIVTRVVFDSIEERFFNQLIEARKLASEWMVREENRLLETQRLLAHTEGMAEAIQAKNSERLRELAYPVAVNAKEEAIEILDREGVALLSMRHRNGAPIEDYEFTGGDDSFKQWPEVMQVLQRKSDNFGDKFTTVMRTKRGETFYIVGPILNAEGKLVGCVLVGESVNTLARQIREATLAQVMLYDLKGQVIATTLLEPQPLTAENVAQVLSQQDGRGFVQDVVASDIAYTEIVGPWQARHSSTMGLLGVLFAKNFMIIFSQNTWLQILISLLLAFVLVLGIGYWISERISDPIIQLELAASRVAAGDLTVHVPSDGNDEIALLTQQFNDMVTRLDNSKSDLVAAYDATLEGWVKALDLRDRETMGHSQRVAELTIKLARRMNVNEADMENIRRGALLHDIGKMAIPDEILLKPASLIEDEWKIMRRHPSYAVQMLKDISFLRPAIAIPGCHHEWWDGSGYPNGFKGEAIPIAARIFAVVDVWDSIRSDRPYRKAMSWSQARNIIAGKSGTHFDPQVVDVFLQIMDASPHS